LPAPRARAPREQAYPTGIDKFNEELLVALIAGERRWDAWAPTHSHGRGKNSPDPSKSGGSKQRTTVAIAAV
jgi:hypothetical protein